jgi:hypothetical protein
MQEEPKNISSHAKTNTNLTRNEVSPVILGLKATNFSIGRSGVAVDYKS